MSSQFRVLLTSTMIFGGSILASSSIAQNQFEEEIRKYEQSDQETPTQPGGILFVGSSSIRMWSTLEADFKGMAALNRGFGGSQTSDVIYFFDRIVAPYKPSKIFLYEGDNDLASGKSSDQVLLDFKTFVTQVRESLPDVDLVFISVKPSPARHHLLKEIRLTNKKVEDFCRDNPDLHYADVFSPMIGSNGRPIPGLFLNDSLHMGPAGYAIWTSRLTPFMND